MLTQTADLVVIGCCLCVSHNESFCTIMYNLYYNELSFDSDTFESIRKLFNIVVDQLLSSKYVYNNKHVSKSKGFTIGFK